MARERVDVVLSESAAVQHVVAMLGEGDLAVILAEDVRRVLTQLQHHAPGSCAL
jgi:hypothetical protein